MGRYASSASVRMPASSGVLAVRSGARSWPRSSNGPSWRTGVLMRSSRHVGGSIAVCVQRRRAAIRQVA